MTDKDISMYMLMHGQYEEDLYEDINDESLVELKKTDYNSHADLTKFVKEYRKAQAMIKECNRLYYSFLKSKLKSFSQLVSNNYNSQINKLYSIDIEKPKKTFDIQEALRVFKYPINYIVKAEGWAVNNGIDAVLEIVSLMASIDIQMKYDEDPDSLFILTMKRDGIMLPHHMVFKKSGNKIEIDKFRVYDYDIHLSLSEFKTKEEYMIYCADVCNKLEKDWFELVKKYLPKVIKYVGYDNLYEARLDYTQIEEELRQMLQNSVISESYKGNKQFNKAKKTTDKIFDKLNDNIISKVNFDLTKFISKKAITEDFYKHITDRINGHWGVPLANTKVKLYDNKDFIKFIDEGVSKFTGYCVSIVKDYSDYNKGMLYITDEKGILHKFCSEQSLTQDCIKIFLSGNKLVCKYVECERDSYNMFTETATDIETTKMIVFDINTNEVIGYKEDVAKYKNKRVWDRY